MHDSQEECIRICVYVSALLCPGPGRHSLKSRRSKKVSVFGRLRRAFRFFMPVCRKKFIYACFRSAGVACRRTAEKRRTAAVHRKGGAGAEGAGAESDAHKAGNGAAAGPSAGAHAVAGKNGTAGGAPYAPPYFRRAYAAVLSVLRSGGGAIL